MCFSRSTLTTIVLSTGVLLGSPVLAEKMKKLLLLSVALAIPVGGAAAGQKPGNWNCGHFSNPDLVVEGYTIKLGPDAVIQAEAYGLVGLTRVWIIDEAKNFQFRIEPDGSGTYIISGLPKLTIPCSQLSDSR